MLSKAKINKLLRNKYILISIVFLVIIVLYLIITTFFTKKINIKEKFYYDENIMGYKASKALALTTNLPWGNPSISNFGNIQATWIGGSDVWKSAVDVGSYLLQKKFRTCKDLNLLASLV